MANTVLQEEEQGKGVQTYWNQGLFCIQERKWTKYLSCLKDGIKMSTKPLSLSMNQA